MYSPLISYFEEIIPLDSDDILFIEQVFTEKFLCKGDFFLEEGQISREIAFIEKGTFGYYWSHEGETKVCYFSQCGELFGNYKSFIEKSPSEMYIECLEDAKIFCISYQNFQLLLKTLKHGERYGRLIIEKVLIEVIHSLHSFYIKTPEERFLEFTNLYPDLVDTIPQYFIASYIGIKPQSLSRIKRRMK